MTATSSADVLCARIEHRLEQSVGPWRYRMFFPRAARLRFDDRQRRLQLQVKNHFVADRIGRGLEADLRAVASSELGETIDFELLIEPQAFPDAGELALDEPAAPTAAPDATPAPILPRTAPALPSDSAPVGAVGFASARPALRRPALRHTLDDFILGPSNELAFQAACSFIDDQQPGSRTLFLHAGCGLGKTHLLQGLCRQLSRQQPDAQVLYVTGEQFTNDFLASVRENRIESFRKRIRRLHLLAIDDVHFIANKQATQREFLHCFDALDLKGARVALASDSHPRSINQFSEALVSRCVRGMVAQISAPDVATRQKLFQELGARRGLPLNEAAVQLLAARCFGSVRDIEGMLTQLHALWHLLPEAQRPLVIGPALVSRLEQSEQRPTPRRAVRFEQILAAVCELLGMEPKRVLSASRHRDLVLARGLVVRLTRQLTTMSFPELGTALKRTSHSTVVTAAQRMEQHIQDNRLVPHPATGELTAVAELEQRARRLVVGSA